MYFRPSLIIVLGIVYRLLKKNLHSYLWNLAHEQEKANEIFDSKSLSVIFNKICPQESHLPKYAIYLSIYDYGADRMNPHWLTQKQVIIVKSRWKHQFVSYHES